MINLDKFMTPMMILCFLIVFIYAKIMFHYCDRIIERKVPQWVIFYATPFMVLIGIICVLSLQAPMAVLYVLVMFILFISFQLTFHAKLEQLYWAALNFVFHLIILRGLVIAVSSLVTLNNMYRIIEDETTYLLTLIITIFLMSVFLFVFNKKVDTSKVKILLNNPRQLRFVYLSETIIFVFELFSTYAYYYNLDLIWFTIFHLITSVMTILSYYITFNYAVKTAKWQKEEIDNSLVQKSLRRLLLRHEDQRVLLESVKRYNHDVKKIIHTINVLLNNEEYNIAKEMLNLIGKEVNINVEKMKKYSNHKLIDSLLYEFYLNCCDAHINLEAECYIPQNLLLTDLDLCRILNNLIDNAFEACLKINQDQEKKITIKSKVNEDWLTILVENTFDLENISLSNSVLQTTKENKEYHGMGIRNIKEIVENNHGNIKIDIQKEIGVFSFWIILPVQS